MPVHLRSITLILLNTKHSPEQTVGLISSTGHSKNHNKKNMFSFRKLHSLVSGKCLNPKISNTAFQYKHISVKWQNFGDGTHRKCDHLKYVTWKAIVNSSIVHGSPPRPLPSPR